MYLDKLSIFKKIHTQAKKSSHLLFFDPIAEPVKCLIRVDMIDDCRQKLAKRFRHVETGVTEQENLGTYRWKENR